MTMNHDDDKRDEYTVPELPPEGARPPRTSKWRDLFDECRANPGVWRRTKESFQRTTAAQIASDVRNSWKRDPVKMRMRGLGPGERWEAVSGPSPEGLDPGRHFLWLRYVGEGDADVVAADEGPVQMNGEPVEYAW